MPNSRPLSAIETGGPEAGSDQRDDARPSPGVGAPVEIRGLSKNFGRVVAIDEVSFDINPGEFVALLGPSGSGKTTILMSIAGFEQPTAGRILVAGRDVVPLPANKRNIGMVFQKYALFPHLSVAENISFPLEMRRWPKDRRKEAVRRALETVRLDGYAERMPSQLSGGQQQRVALARAIVFEPPVLLMDEPLGALDKKLREELQLEIKRLQQRLGITVLFVTHDQGEALAMADRVAVMNNGRIEQIGTPRALYNEPETLFVADFVGDSNLLTGAMAESGRQRQGVERLKLARGGSVAGRVATHYGGDLMPGRPATLMVRPENVKLRRAERWATDDGLSGTVRDAVFGGATTMFVVELPAMELRAQLAAGSGGDGEIRVGDRVAVSWDARDARIYPAERSG